MKPANLFFRNDTIFGVCEAIGQDFGFHPNFLRITLACLVYFAPVAVIGGYLVAGLIVALSRWIAPNEQIAAPALPVAEYQLLEAGFEGEDDKVQLAA